MRTRVTVNLGEETAKRLKKYSSKSGHSVSRISENAILQWFGDRTRSSILLRMTSLQDTIEAIQSQTEINAELQYMTMAILYKYLAKEPEKIKEILPILVDRILENKLIVKKIKEAFHSEEIEEIEEEDYMD